MWLLETSLARSLFKWVLHFYKRLCPCVFPFVQLCVAECAKTVVDATRIIEIGDKATKIFRVHRFNFCYLRLWLRLSKMSLWFLIVRDAPLSACLLTTPYKAIPSEKKRKFSWPDWEKRVMEGKENTALFSKRCVLLRRVAVANGEPERV